MSMPPTIETTRLQLDVLTTSHLPAMHGLFSAAGHTIGDGPIADVEETNRWLQRRREIYSTQGLAWYRVWTRSDRGFVGTCGVFRGQRCGSDPEIGYEVATALRGFGFAKEAAKVVTDAAHDSGNRELWATIRPANAVSIHVVESIGYEHTRTDEDEKGQLAYFRSSR